MYVMKSGSFFKIGVAQDPEARLLSLQTGNPQIELVYVSKKIGNAHEVENRLHRAFSEFCVRGEWFSICCECKLINEVRAMVDRIGVDTDRAEENEIKKAVPILVDWVLREKLDQLETIGKEVEKIKKENEELAEELIRLGWTPEEIKSLIDDAVKAAL